jgi:signal transduction histidine kinase
MMEIIMENAGAQAGALLLETDGKMVMRACKTGDASAVSIHDGTSPAEADWIPAAIVNYVARRRESVVIDDASIDQRFGHDAAVRARQPKSIMCTPIRHKGDLTGTLYLENNLVTGAFTRARLEALNILVAQIAVSIENATLFAKQKEHADALGAYRDHLAELVAERTKELTDANGRLMDESIARERMEIELRLAQRLQTVGQLAAGVAHEINTPMQYVGSNLEFLNTAFGDVFAVVDHLQAQDGLAVADAKRAKRMTFLRKQVPPALEQALEGVARVTEIVAAMKAFSHPGHKDRALTNVNEAIQNTLVVGKNEYKYVADVEVDLGDIPLVMSHVGEMNQVLLNLIVNAAHAIQDVVNGTANRGTIRITTRLEDEATIVIGVSDTGCGIPEAIKDRIFDPFFTTKDVGRGTGQGLAIARSVVDRHGGSLTFESESGKGTAFFVRLPVGAPASANPEPTAAFCS